MSKLTRPKGFNLLLCLLLASCDWIEYHPYDIWKTTESKNPNNFYISKIEQADNQHDTTQFAFMGDSQRFYDETADFVKEINQRDDIDFVIYGGDITDFGMSKESMWIHDLMKNLQVPYVALIGNHDLIGHGKEVYHSRVGSIFKLFEKYGKSNE